MVRDSVRRFLPFGALLCLAAAIFALGLHQRLNFPWLVEQQDTLRSFVAAHPIGAPLAYTALYTAMVACAIPGGVVLSSAAGFLFGTVLGGAYALTAVTVGAVLLFLVARSSLRPLAERHAGALIRKLTPGLERNGFSYLLAVRLVPLTPFWAVNVAAAVAGMRIGPYALATVIGIAPVTFVFASAGAGLGSSMEAGVQPGLHLLLRPALLLPLLGLAALALAPVAWRRFRPVSVPANPQEG